jgi:anti-anti-sigma regulatory factor
MPILTSLLYVTGARHPNGVQAVVLAGVADASNFHDLAAALFDHMPDGVRRMIVDAQNLTAIDELAARSLAQAARVLASREGQLTLLRPKDTVLAVLQECGAAVDMFIQP